MVVLIVRFKQEGISVADAKTLNESMVPKVGQQPGFISKLWLGNDETGRFAGVYQFQTKADVETYLQSEIIATLKSLPTLFGALEFETYNVYRNQSV